LKTLDYVGIVSRFAVVPGEKLLKPSLLRKAADPGGSISGDRHEAAPDP
jgi:hypothetical protein